MPYLRDLIFDAAQNDTRLFLSHLTSSTHHPWRTPKSFHREQYTGGEGSVDHDSMNDYLNTVRYVDDWLGEILGLLDEAGISNSTLVVIIGDQYVSLHPSLSSMLTNSADKPFRKMPRSLVPLKTDISVISVCRLYSDTLNCLILTSRPTRRLLPSFQRFWISSFRAGL